MAKENVLVLGNSGVGKSTLINAVLGENVAKTGSGTKGITDKLAVYESKDEAVPFRLIDTIGFVPNIIKQQQAIAAVKQWSRECVKEGKEDGQINVIWFCVDGTRRKLFDEDIRSMMRAASMWKSVPIVVVITKSYSVPDRTENMEMVRQAFEKHHNYGSNLRAIIPVVAEIYTLNDTAYAPPEGISELIETTGKCIPEGLQAAKKDIGVFILNRKRAMAQSVVAASTAAGVVVGAVPIPFQDALLLGPTEVAEVNAIAKIYGIGKDDTSKQFLNSIVEVGTVSLAARALISGLKAVPGINLAASVLDAAIAGVIITAIGEGSVYAFEQVYLGNKSLTDVDWVKKIMESEMSSTIVEKAKPFLAKLSNESDKRTIIATILEFAGSIVQSKQKIK